ncbi:hypothetical protein AMV023 [Betaentomopoxvirus amoorei]|uniref:AMV023 n=1 Tax=Amsacta moorei entomopoxvirus TaxID=28321 RepID=Q9EN25_AMEPV|nr:hypothetical protein AMV023 [Amsacta moorei entomopoxvirus]AAG02729.1 AMV023 [Amsacta moorei entomopoxvirus]
MENVTFKKIVGKTRQVFFRSDGLKNNCLAISIIINEVCKKYNIKCNIIRKYISEDNIKFYNHFVVTNGKEEYDTTLIPSNFIYDKIPYINNLSEKDQEYESKLYEEYCLYCDGKLDNFINKIKYKYIDKIFLLLN